MAREMEVKCTLEGRNNYSLCSGTVPDGSGDRTLGRGIHWMMNISSLKAARGISR